MSPVPELTSSSYPELDTGVQWSALVAFAVVLLGGMQGALGMESVSHCRLSYGKLRVILFLQTLLVALGISAQIHSFLHLQAVLSAPNAPLRWLQWEAASILALGIALILIDIYATLAACAGSRVLWNPLSCAYRLQGNFLDTTARIIETFALFSSACLVMLLIGWRKHWWLEAAVVQSSTSAQREAALSGGAEGACVGAGVFVIGLVLLTIASFEANRLIGVAHSKAHTRGPGVFELARYMARPTSWVSNTASNGDIGKFTVRRTVMQRDASPEHHRVFRLLHEIDHGEDQGITFSRLSTSENLERAPLHFGNAVITPDHHHVTNPLTENLKIAILIAPNLSVLPLLTCVVVGVVRLRSVLDRETLRALSALADAVIVLALITLAVGTKLAVWRTINFVDVHEYDVGPDDH